MKTTLKQIRAARPCGLRLEDDGRRTGYLKLKHHLGRGYGDNTPISLATVLDSNGFNDALWCFAAVPGHNREKRLYGVWCVRRVEPLMADGRSTNALLVSERYANGLATEAELAAAEAAAWAAATATARATATATARDAAWAAARADAWGAWDAARGASWAAAWAADGWAVARTAARAAQADELRRVCACIDAREDPYPFNTETTRCG